MTASDNSNEPWVTGEFDITSLVRGAPRILNKPQFIDHVDRELQRAKRSIESRFAVILLNLDSHGTIVAEKGRKAAELVIRAIIEPVGGMLAPRDAIAVFGTGTVGILLETARLRGTAKDFAAEMVGEMKKAAADCALPDATFSVGIAKVSGSYVLGEDILRDAGIALHAAENDGHDRTVVFYFGMEDPAHTSIAI